MTCAQPTSTKPGSPFHLSLEAEWHHLFHGNWSPLWDIKKESCGLSLKKKVNKRAASWWCIWFWNIPLSPSCVNPIIAVERFRELGLYLEWFVKVIKWSSVKFKLHTAMQGDEVFSCEKHLFVLIQFHLLLKLFDLLDDEKHSIKSQLPTLNFNFA